MDVHWTLAVGLIIIQRLKILILAMRRKALAIQNRLWMVCSNVFNHCLSIFTLFVMTVNGKKWFGCDECGALISKYILPRYKSQHYKAVMEVIYHKTQSCGMLFYCAACDVSCIRAARFQVHVGNQTHWSNVNKIVYKGQDCACGSAF
eukprot:810100_1